MKRDGASNLQVAVSSVGNALGTADAGTKVEGAPVDVSNFSEVTCVIATATLGDPDVTLTPEIEESDTLVDADFSAVADADLVGSEGSLANTDDLTTRKIGYVGTKKYIRVNVTPAATSDATPTTFMGLVINGAARKSPLDQEHKNELTAS